MEILVVMFAHLLMHKIVVVKSTEETKRQIRNVPLCNLGKLSHPKKVRSRSKHHLNQDLFYVNLHVARLICCDRFSDDEFVLTCRMFCEKLLKLMMSTSCVR